MTCLNCYDFRAMDRERFIAFSGSMIPTGLYRVDRNEAAAAIILLEEVVICWKFVEISTGKTALTVLHGIGTHGLD